MQTIKLESPPTQDTLPQVRLNNLPPAPVSKPDDSLQALVLALQGVEETVRHALNQAGKASEQTREAQRRAVAAEAAKLRLESDLVQALNKIQQLEKLERVPRWVRKMFGAA